MKAQLESAREQQGLALAQRIAGPGYCRRLGNAQAPAETLVVLSTKAWRVEPADIVVERQDARPVVRMKVRAHGPAHEWSASESHSAGNNWESTSGPPKFVIA